MREAVLEKPRHAAPEPDFPIPEAGEPSRAARSRGYRRYAELAQAVRALPYGRTQDVMDTGARCACNRSLAAVCGFFAGLAVALYLTGDRCLDGGGRLSDAAWTCESASGAVGPLLGLATPGIIAVAALVAIPAYFAVSAIGRRWLFRYGRGRG